MGSDKKFESPGRVSAIFPHHFGHTTLQKGLWQSQKSSSHGASLDNVKLRISTSSSMGVTQTSP